MHGESPELFADPSNADEDDFVDARETPMPPSPSASRARLRRLGSRQMENKVEELGMENESLKLVVDRLSGRLHAFEMSAQKSSMALQESMRMMRDMSPVRAPLSRGNSSANEGEYEGLKSKVGELEENVRIGVREVERLGRENEKLRSVVARYRERWEKLKEGAKTRREGNGGKRDDGALL